MSSERQKRQIYNHPNSISRRSGEPEDALAALHKRHAEERGVDGQHRHKATTDLEKQFDAERARDTTFGQRRDPPKMEQRRRELRKSLDKKTAAMESRHAAEIKEAEKKIHCRDQWLKRRP